MDENEKTYEKSIEETFEELDRMAESMESGTLSLEESFEVYAKGMKLLSEIHERIDRVEKKMLLLGENNSLTKELPAEEDA